MLLFDNSLIQLKNGKLLFYYFRQRTSIQLYNEKTFNKILEIDLNEIIEKYKKETEGENPEEELLDFRKLDTKEKRLRYFKLQRQLENERNSIKKISIKELDEGIILLGYNKYLFELKLNFNKNIFSYDIQIVNKLDNSILDINELPNKSILVIFDKKIIILKKEETKYIIEKEYPIKTKWEITPHSLTRRHYGDFKQYYSSYILPNEKLLIKSFSTELDYHGGCGTHPPREFSDSKYIFINLINFVEINITETFKDTDTKCIILNDIIVIHSYKDIFVYDLNTVELVNKIQLQNFCGYLYK